jgi:hypothetical protein
LNQESERQGLVVQQKISKVNCERMGVNSKCLTFRSQVDNMWVTASRSLENPRMNSTDSCHRLFVCWEWTKVEMMGKAWNKKMSSWIMNE